MLLAALLRFTGQNWDQGQNLHPDERFITMVATALQWPSGPGEYFDTAVNPLNPYNLENLPPSSTAPFRSMPPSSGAS